MPDNITQTSRQARPPQDNIPQTRKQRDMLLDIIKKYFEDKVIIPPVSLDQLREYSHAVIELADIDSKYIDYAAILVNNEIWRSTISSIPYNKRLLLLPQCLRDHEKCTADIDQLGLICNHCGNCLINEFQSQAEELGYAVLVAEGSPVVMSLVESGKVDAVIGVSCLSVLENVFPYMEAGAVPGIAIPLLYDGCKNTHIDVDWLWEAIYLNSADESAVINIDFLRKQVDSWFVDASLKKALSVSEHHVEKVAYEWLARAGKRWRPFLVAGVYSALCRSDDEVLPEKLRDVAIAVECFHKASLIHDDIEDGDSHRYGREALHVQYGIPIALNAGDFLLGEGYRLLAETDTSDSCKAEMLAVAAHGHRNLCIGQGSELAWNRETKPLSVSEVIEIFKNKTAPAFEVALKFGAIYAEAGDTLNKVLEEYSRAIGIAYQIQDDIDDFADTDSQGDLKTLRPSILLALAYEKAEGDDKKLLHSIWTREVPFNSVADDITAVFEKLDIKRATCNMMEMYKSQAIGSLAALENSALKTLLRRVISKIFNDIEVMECCDDYQARLDKNRRGGKDNVR